MSNTKFQTFIFSGVVKGIAEHCLSFDIPDEVVREMAETLAEDDADLSEIFHEIHRLALRDEVRKMVIVELGEGSSEVMINTCVAEVFRQDLLNLRENGFDIVEAVRATINMIRAVYRLRREHTKRLEVLNERLQTEEVIR